MLYIIGLGLDKKDVTLKGLEAMKKCDKLYLDIYTSALPYSMDELEEVAGQKIYPAGRALLENEAETIIMEAKGNSIGILVAGDPLSATTHIDLVSRAEKSKVKVEVMHSVSILTAIAETGLQLYKFGKIASIPKFKPNYAPESWYDLMMHNMMNEAHTLLLLDAELEVPEALNYICDISRKRNDGILEKDIVLCSCLGTPGRKIKAGKIKDLAKDAKKLNLKMPACFALPAKLHFVEEAFLKKFRRD